MNVLCTHCGAFALPGVDTLRDRYICSECYSPSVHEHATCDRKGCAAPAAKGTDYCAEHDAEITAFEANVDARQEREAADYNRRAAA